MCFFYLEGEVAHALGGELALDAEDGLAVHALHDQDLFFGASGGGGIVWWVDEGKGKSTTTYTIQNRMTTTVYTSVVCRACMHASRSDTRAWYTA